jgi:hypothetical protein
LAARPVKNRAGILAPPALFGNGEALSGVIPNGVFGVRNLSGAGVSRYCSIGSAIPAWVRACTMPTLQIFMALYG